MKVVYRGRQDWRSNAELMDEGDVLELQSDNWDDFSNKTTFGTVCRINSEYVELGALKLMVADYSRTTAKLDEIYPDLWDGVFPIPDVDYLSVPSEITFYEQIASLLGEEAALAVAVALRDASYLVNTAQDEAAIALTQTTPFNKSLQRERGSVKAFLDGWKIFARQTMAVLDLGFHFRDVFGAVSTLDLKFQSDGPLPHDVNVLIGANGAGKSRVLHQMVEDWINPPDKPDGVGFVQKPNLSQIVVVSYSPFEQFHVDLATSKLKDKNAYRYFGLRARGPAREDGRLPSIRVNQQVPKRNAALALLECVADDQRFRRLSTWAEKLKTVEQVLRYAFDFEFAAVRVDSDAPVSRHIADFFDIEKPLLVTDGPYAGRYVPIKSSELNDLNLAEIREDLVAAEGVHFFQDGVPVELSSGQRLFSFIVINILGAIRRDSLVLIDEPELFLHPALEIQFIDMLKTILDRFNSKALVATHSEVTVREVPSACVHVLTRTDDGLAVTKPPFQTFGGDVQRISSYVFNDNETAKPFVRWIHQNLKRYDGAEALLAALGDAVNEELVIQIRALDKLRGFDDL